MKGFEQFVILAAAGATVLLAWKSLRSPTSAPISTPDTGESILSGSVVPAQIGPANTVGGTSVAHSPTVAPGNQVIAQPAQTEPSVPVNPGAVAWWETTNMGA